jgi:hypothetical protein
MTKRLKWLLQVYSVALVAACGAGSSDDVVIRTDAEPAAATTTNVATDVDPSAKTTAPTADIKADRNGR